MNDNFSKSVIIIRCLDNSTRKITVSGRWSYDMAKSLASDTESGNIKYILVNYI